jgi:hypothetical protein
MIQKDKQAATTFTDGVEAAAQLILGAVGRCRKELGLPVPEHPEGFKQAGVASAMPGTDAWTIVVYKAEDVPVGTPLYKKG